MTTNKGVTDISQPSLQGDGVAVTAPLSATGGPAAAGGKNDNQAYRGANPILKSGPLFISSKGIGWTSWKKRWFILTKTSLVFFRSDPSVVAQKGSEANLTLGGIDLNNSGSVVVKVDKKLLTVLFPDGRDGRAFTLKAETSEDLFEWRNALEIALAQAPSTHNVLGQNVMGQNGVIRNDQPEVAAANDKPPPASLVLGRPILLALEDVDGSPSFLEKALKFIEEYGVKVEGILRQAADVDDVEYRIREYEQGKTEFIPGEDAHVVGDCIKYFLRELPSSPVPASCCHALLDACRSGNRVASMRTAIMETFPEPNRRLLQRILVMMQQVAAHKERNRMSISAVSACMAPLLLRPLLSGDCEIENDFDVGGDGSMQLLQAAAAANHAQAIVITLMEEYESIFSVRFLLFTLFLSSSDGAMSPGLYSDSEEGESEDEEVTEDDESYEDEDDEVSLGSEEYSDDYIEDGSNGSCTESHVSDEDDLADTKGSGDPSTQSKSSEVLNFKKEMPSSDQNPILQSDVDKQDKGQNESKKELSHSDQLSTQNDKSYPHMRKSSSISSRHERKTQWGRTSAKKNLSMESIDFTLEDEEAEIQKLEASKVALHKKIAEESEGNAVLQANLEERKKALRERRNALKQDVTRLREQLQMERERRSVLESGLNSSDELANIKDTFDEKTKADLKEISEANAEITDFQKEVDKLNDQLIRPHEQKFDSAIVSSDHRGKLQKDAEATTTLHGIGRSTSKVGRMGRTKSSKDKKQESNLNKTDPAQSDNTRSTSFNKSGSKAEELKPSTAITKLTNRVKFLKERRSQGNNDSEGRGSEEAGESCDRSRKQDEVSPDSEGHKSNAQGGSSRTDSR
ncbi:Rho GTPase-activating protein REN1 [Linum perenne]